MPKKKQAQPTDKYSAEIEYVKELSLKIQEAVAAAQKEKKDA